MKKKTKLAIIGMGERGTALTSLLVTMPNVSIVAICDSNPKRLAQGITAIKENTGNDPLAFSDYRQLLMQPQVEGVIIATPCHQHGEIAIASMRAGKYAAFEAGGFASIEECWQLVRTAEATNTHCMLLENCCYGQKELMLLNMIQKGVFGDVVYCEGTYEHDLRELLVRGYQTSGNPRVLNYLHRNGDIYPSHSLGPIMKYLSINRGNRLLTLTSSSTKAVGLKSWIVGNLEEGNYFSESKFQEGDIVSTMVTCAGGESLLLLHDTTLPRPYSRGGVIQGTNGIWMENADHITLDGKPMQDIFANKGSIHLEDITPRLNVDDAPIKETGLDARWESMRNYEQKYEHPLWIEMIDSGTMARFPGDSCVNKGMDFLVLSAFTESVRSQSAPPIDVYDTAVMVAITCLSEQSIALGSRPVAIPDFTNGRWIERKVDTSKYSLNF